jgi:hypothetical protein
MYNKLIYYSLYLLYGKCVGDSGKVFILAEKTARGSVVYHSVLRKYGVVWHVPLKSRMAGTQQWGLTLPDEPTIISKVKQLLQKMVGRRFCYPCIDTFFDHFTDPNPLLL